MHEPAEQIEPGVALPHLLPEIRRPMARGVRRVARPLVVAVSFSGDTSETVDGVTAAQAAGLPLALVSSGGRLGGFTGGTAWKVHLLAVEGAATGGGR